MPAGGAGLERPRIVTRTPRDPQQARIHGCLLGYRIFALRFHPLQHRRSVFSTRTMAAPADLAGLSLADVAGFRIVRRTDRRHACAAGGNRGRGAQRAKRAGTRASHVQAPGHPVFDAAGSNRFSPPSASPNAPAARSRAGRPSDGGRGMVPDWRPRRRRDGQHSRLGTRPAPARFAPVPGRCIFHRRHREAQSSATCSKRQCPSPEDAARHIIRAPARLRRAAP